MRKKIIKATLIAIGVGIWIPGGIEMLLIPALASWLHNAVTAVTIVYASATAMIAAGWLI